MSLSRLQTEKVKPLPSSRVNTPRTIKTKGKNTPRAETFKNPLLGIEVNLIQKIQEVNEQYHDTSFKKRKVLLDALEDVADSKTGFRNQILYVLKIWKPPKPDTVMFKTTALADLLRTQKHLRQIASDHETADNRIRNLKQEIQMTELEIDEYNSKIDQIKNKLMQQSDHFVLSRKLNDSIINLQESFNSIFVPPKKKAENEDINKLLAENAQLKKDRTRMLYELNICKQISKRMELNESAQSDDDYDN